MGQEHGIWWDESGLRNPFAPGGGYSFTSAAVRVDRLYVVEGRGDFPVDMLRYDRAFCLTPIPHPHLPWYGRKFRVVLGFAENYAPTVARWESFGWRVGPRLPKSSDVGKLQRRVLSWRNVCHRCERDNRGQGYEMSWFDGAFVCETCAQEERRHPDFDMARNSLRCALAQGNLAFDGVGWPGRHGRV
jgi:hypothetical protein